MEDTKVCSRCGERLPVDHFYFVSKKLGTRRGQCKECMREVKAAQRDPEWLPTCTSCGDERPRVGPGRRLCHPCFTSRYSLEDRRPNGSARLALKPCPNCGATRTREDHTPNTMLCAQCRSVSQGRRKKLKGYYNLTPAEAQAIIEAQGMGCAICGARPRNRHLSIDHQHAEPSLIRGAICTPCNTVLGLVRDDVDRLRAVIEYLADPPAQKVVPGRCANAHANKSHEWTKNPYANRKWAAK